MFIGPCIAVYFYSKSNMMQQLVGFAVGRNECLSVYNATSINEECISEKHGDWEVLTLSHN
jgi:hypothetical protein